MRPTRLLPVLTLLWLGAGTAHAQTTLTCGQDATGVLVSNNIDRYRFVVADGDAISIDTVSSSDPDGGEVFIRVIDPFGDLWDSDCGYGLDLLDLDRGSYGIQVSRCDGLPGPVRYGLTVSGISETLNGRGACGEVLSCNRDNVITNLPDQDPGPDEFSGQARAFRFTQASRGPVRLSVKEHTPRLGLLEMRLYDPNGVLVDDTCEGSISARIGPGVHTVIVNHCVGLKSGDFRVSFDSDDCGLLPNDQCAGATVVSATPYTDVVNIQPATTDASDPTPRCGSGIRDQSVWYQFTAPSNGTVTADTFGSTFDSVLSIHTGACNNLNAVIGACNDDDDSNPLITESRVSFLAIAGTTYRFMVTSFDLEGLLTFSVNFTSTGPSATPTVTPTITRTPSPTPTSPIATSTITVTATPSTTMRSPTPTTPGATCIGDCNHDVNVTVDELVRGTNIALGNRPVSDCPVLDANRSGEVTIDELIRAVNAALNGC